MCWVIGVLESVIVSRCYFFVEGVVIEVFFVEFDIKEVEVFVNGGVCFDCYVVVMFYDIVKGVVVNLIGLVGLVVEVGDVEWVFWIWEILGVRVDV